VKVKENVGHSWPLEGQEDATSSKDAAAHHAGLAF